MVRDEAHIGLCHSTQRLGVRERAGEADRRGTQAQLGRATLEERSVAAIADQYQLDGKPVGEDRGGGFENLEDAARHFHEAEIDEPERRADGAHGARCAHARARRCVGHYRTTFARHAERHEAFGRLLDDGEDVIDARQGGAFELGDYPRVAQEKVEWACPSRVPDILDHRRVVLCEVHGDGEAESARDPERRRRQREVADDDNVGP